MLKKCLCLILLGCLTYATTLTAQEVEPSSKALRKEKRQERRDNTTRFSHFGSYLSYWAIQDTRMAPSIFRGPGVGLQSGSSIYRPKAIYNLTLDALFSYTIPPHGETNLMSVFVGSDFSWLPNKQRDGWTVGVNLNGFYHIRINNALGNSSINWDASAGIGPIINWKKERKLGKKMTTFKFTASTPLFSYINRQPAFGLSFSDGVSYLHPIGKFNRISTSLSFERLFRRSQENRIRYGYHWDFYNLSEQDDLHKLHIANHRLSMTLLINK